MFKRYIFALGTLPFLLSQGCGHLGRSQVIYIARHGQTEWNRTGRFQGDPDLDPVGYINRVNLWHLLKDKPLQAIYTSERLRTQRTAELLSRQHGLPIQVRPELNEIDGGIMVGICDSQLSPDKTDPQKDPCKVKATHSHPEATLKYIRSAYQAAWSDRVDGKFPLAQSFRELAAQIAPFVEELKRSLRSPILIVGHGLTNRALLHHLLHWSLENVASLKQDNDQVYRVEFRGDLSFVSLYTPGYGWKKCSASPQRGDIYLDCHPHISGAAQNAPSKSPTSVEPQPPEALPEAQTPQGAPHTTSPALAPTPVEKGATLKDNAADSAPADEESQ